MTGNRILNIISFSHAIQRCVYNVNAILDDSYSLKSYNLIF